MEGVTIQRPAANSAPLIWAIAVRLSPEMYPQGRDAVAIALAARGIETRPGFQTPSEMNYFATQFFAVSDQLGRWVISLPTFPDLEDADIDFICTELHALAAH
jgi:dTDP-4-amino-4,6-dideoxygalactose transaminase